MKMDKLSLTKAYIQRVSVFKKSNFEIQIIDIKELNKYPFFLVIQAVVEHYIKLSIYPLNEEKVTKVSLTSSNFSSENFDDLSRILREYRVIHTSGVVLIENRFFYECYLIMSEDKEKSKNLKASFNKIKSKFEEIKIEEIILSKII